jgi:hypothetical protein
MANIAWDIKLNRERYYIQTLLKVSTQSTYVAAVIKHHNKEAVSRKANILSLRDATGFMSRMAWTTVNENRARCRC